MPEIESNINNKIPRTFATKVIKPSSKDITEIYIGWKEFFLKDIPKDIEEFWKWISGRGDERDISFEKPIHNCVSNPVFEK